MEPSEYCQLPERSLHSQPAEAAAEAAEEDKSQGSPVVCYRDLQVRV